MTSTISVSTGDSTSIIVMTPMTEIVETISCGSPWLSISRMASVSLVNRLMISPCVRVSKYLRGSVCSRSNISQRTVSKMPVDTFSSSRLPTKVPSAPSA